jgi:hypothetical protein
MTRGGTPSGSAPAATRGSRVQRAWIHAGSRARRLGPAGPDPRRQPREAPRADGPGSTPAVARAAWTGAGGGEEARSEDGGCLASKGRRQREAVEVVSLVPGGGVGGGGEEGKEGGRGRCPGE